MVTHVNGNDISFASKESGKAPKLTISLVDEVATNIDSEETTSVIVSPNPFKDFIQVKSNEEIIQVLIYDMTGSVFVITSYSIHYTKLYE